MITPKCHSQKLRIGCSDAPTNSDKLGYRAATDAPRSKPKRAGLGKNKAGNTHLNHLLW